MTTNTGGRVDEVVLVHGLSAEEIDERLRRACRAADVGHRATAFYLADLHERGLAQVLGLPTTVAYAVRELGMSRRQARELLRTGLRLQELPEIDAAFAESRLSWSRVRRLCEVAMPETEREWLDRGLRCSQDELDALVRRCRRGDRPPVGEGLPGPRFAVRLELDAVQWQMWENARAKLRAELGSLNDEVRDEDLLLEMMRLLLSSDADGTVAGRKAVDGGPFRVLVREGGGDATPAVVGPDGEEPVEPEVAEGVMGDAAIPPKLRARVLARDGHRCRNCGARRGLHAHHVVWRDRGGATAEENLVTLCARCHGLVHHGLLDVEVAQCATGARPRRPGFVFRNAHGRRLGGRLLCGPRTAPRAQGGAQCATGGDGPREKPDPGGSRGTWTGSTRSGGGWC